MSQVWSEDKLIVLLAWVDFCLSNNMNFKESILEHLYRRTNCEFLWQQVSNKLTKLSSRYGENSGWQEVLTAGSKSINRFSADLHDKISLELAEYEKDYLKAPEKLTQGESFLQQSQEHQTEEVQLNTIQPDQPNIQENNNQGPQEQPPSSKIPRERSNTAKLTGPSARVNADSDPALNEMRMHEKELEHERELQVIRFQWHQEVETLTRQSIKQTRKEEELRAKIHHLEMSRNRRRQAGNGSLEDELFSKNHEIWALTRRVQEMIDLTSLAECDVSPEPTQHWGLLEDALDTMENEMGNVLCDYDISAPLLIPEILKGDLAALIRSNAGKELGCGEEGQYLKNVVLKFDQALILASITWTGLKEWVFSSAFPDFVPKRQTRLLQAYRDVVMTQGGWARLHNLELAAYRSIIRSQYFQETVIPQKARIFANLLSSALDKVFPRRQDRPKDIRIESSETPSNVPADKVSPFVGIFETAFRLKAITVITDRSYEFVVYPLGKLSCCNEKTPQTGSWILASLQAYELSTSGPSDITPDALIQPKNFVTRSDKERQESCIYKKALMLSKDFNEPRDDRHPFHDGNVEMAENHQLFQESPKEYRRRQKRQRRQGSLDTSQARVNTPNAQPQKHGSSSRGSANAETPRKRHRGSNRQASEESYH